MPLLERLRRFLLHDDDTDDFEALALALCAHQRAHNPDYAAICGDVPPPRRWQDIPAVPVALFRDLPLTAFPPAQATRTFLTSGTTGPRGAHRLRDTTLADQAARRWAEQCVGPIPRRGVSLVSHAPSSSLGHMCRHLAPDHLLSCFDPARGVDTAAAWAALRAARVPVFVPGTAFAFADLLAAPEAPHAPLALPEGSVVMVTGGFKGRVRTLSEDEVLDGLRRLLPGSRLVGEYGMTELSSQLWSLPVGGAFVAPPWLRVLAVDPVTGAPARRGLLRFFDLASHDTVLAIETRDLGEVYDGGRVALLGRSPGAPPRGCSLTVEEASAPPPPPPAPRPAPRFDHTPLPHTPPAPVLRASRADRARVRQVLGALATLRVLPLEPEVTDGLPVAVALAGQDTCLSALTEAALLAELSTVPAAQRPARVSIVCAQGVFTAPVEWAALCAAAGCRVHLKAPAAAPGYLYRLGDALAAAGLPVTTSTARDLCAPDAVVTFGSDETLAEVRAAWPDARHLGFGHRFSLIWADGPEDAEDIAADVLAYETRGCMAPAAIFVAQAQAPALVARLQAALLRQQVPPAAPLPDALGPEWRRRIFLARARGVGGAWADPASGAAVVCLPAADLSPATLPRMAVVHPLSRPEEALQALAPWKHHLSSLAVGTGAQVPEVLRAWVPRLCAAGQLQRPAFPRRHDGVPMLRGICGLEEERT